MSCLAQWVHHSASHQHRWGYFSFSYGAGENNGHWSCGLKLCYFSYGVKLPVLSVVLYDCCLSYCTIWPQFNFESTQTVKHQNYCFVRLNNNKSCPMKRFVCVCVFLYRYSIGFLSVCRGKWNVAVTWNVSLNVGENPHVHWFSPL